MRACDSGAALSTRGSGQTALPVASGEESHCRRILVVNEVHGASALNAGLVSTIVIEVLVHSLCRFVRVGMTDNSRGYTSNGGMRGYFLQNYATSSNFRSLTHPYVSKYLCAGANQYTSPDLWVAISARFPSAAERYFLQYRYIVVDDRSFADYDTSPVINKYAMANDCRWMDVDGKDFGDSTL